MRVCVFCGSSPGSRPIYLEGARAVGRALAERGVGVVYGGASVGCMGAVADAALEAGGEVIGVIPHSMVDRELAHPGLTDLHVVEGMHERKALMTALSDAFLALPGGHGTLDELFEALTWAQLGIHAQPIGVWNLEGYWDPLFAMLDRVVEEGFLRPHHRTLLLSSHALEPLIDSLVS
ncbi:MAG: TIGR00730 family Rossman fold protein [Sandaracinaceae bacterium]|nr:TIGR00730 family Rossman fold protein [Myxococcales bacterium]